MSHLLCACCWRPFTRSAYLLTHEAQPYCEREDCEPYPSPFETRAANRLARAAAQNAPGRALAPEPAQLPLVTQRSRKGQRAVRRVEVIRSDLL